MQVCKGEDPNQLVICDGCFKGWHIRCLNPPLSEVPYSDWYCSSICSSDKNGRRDNTACHKVAAFSPQQDQSMQMDSPAQIRSKRSRTSTSLEPIGSERRRKKLMAEPNFEGDEDGDGDGGEDGLADKYQRLLFRHFSPKNTVVEFKAQNGKHKDVLEGSVRLKYPSSIAVIVYVTGWDRKPFKDKKDLQSIAERIELRILRDNDAAPFADPSSWTIKENRCLEQFFTLTEAGQYKMEVLWQRITLIGVPLVVSVEDCQNLYGIKLTSNKGPNSDFMAGEVLLLRISLNDGGNCLDSSSRSWDQILSQINLVHAYMAKTDIICAKQFIPGPEPRFLQLTFDSAKLAHGDHIFEVRKCSSPDVLLTSCSITILPGEPDHATFLEVQIDGMSSKIMSGSPWKIDFEIRNKYGIPVDVAIAAAFFNPFPSERGESRSAESEIFPRLKVKRIDPDRSGPPGSFDSELDNKSLQLEIVGGYSGELRLQMEIGLTVE